MRKIVCSILAAAMLFAGCTKSDDKMSNRLIKNSSLSFINLEKNFISKLKQEKGLTMVSKKNMMK